MNMANTVTRKIRIANPTDRYMLRRPGSQYGYRAFLLAFGACYPTYVLAYADGLDSALEEAAEWLAVNAPGLLVSEAEHTELCRGAVEEAGLKWDMEANWDDAAWVEAIESAEADLIYTEAGWVPSHEWSIVSEDISPEDLRDFAHGASGSF